MEEIILKVQGMACEGCEKRIQNAIKAINGVEKVVANHKEAIVQITTKKEIDIEIIKEKIKDIGFKIIENK